MGGEAGQVDAHAPKISRGAADEQSHRNVDDHRDSTVGELFVPGGSRAHEAQPQTSRE